MNLLVSEQYIDSIIHGATIKEDNLAVHLMLGYVGVRAGRSGFREAIDLLLLS